MTKTLIGILLVTGLSYLLSPIAWWTFALPSFLVPLALASKGNGFLMSFFGIAALNLACIGMVNFQNEGLLAAKIGAVFQGLPGTVVLLLSMLIPALLAGLCGWSAMPFRSLFLEQKASE